VYLVHPRNTYRVTVCICRSHNLDTRVHVYACIVNAYACVRARARARAFKLFLLFLHRDAVVTYPASLSTPLPIGVQSICALERSMFLRTTLPRECILLHACIRCIDGKTERERDRGKWMVAMSFLKSIRVRHAYTRAFKFPLLFSPRALGAILGNAFRLYREADTAAGITNDKRKAT